MRCKHMVEEKVEEKAEENKGLVTEFMDFLMKYQVIGLAVAFIIGAAATKMVTATVADIIMPVIAVLIPGGDWRASVLQWARLNCLSAILWGRLLISLSLLSLFSLL